MGYSSTGVVKWVEPAAGDGKLEMEDLVTTQRFHVICMIVVPTFMSVLYACVVLKKKTLDPLELESQNMVNYYVGAGN